MRTRTAHRILVLVAVFTLATSCGSNSDQLDVAESTTSSAPEATIVEDIDEPTSAVAIDVLFDDPRSTAVAADGTAILLKMTEGEMDPSATFPNDLTVSMVNLARWPQSDGTFAYTAQQFSLAEDSSSASCGSAQGRFSASDTATTAIWDRGARPTNGGFDESMEEL